MARTYEIIQIPSCEGGGYYLKMFKDNRQVGQRLFPVRKADAAVVLRWQIALELKRDEWFRKAKSHNLPDLFHAYLTSCAYDDANAAALDWLDSEK